MAANRSSASALACAIFTVALAIGGWWWRSQVMTSEAVEVPEQPWEPVRDRFPLPAAETEPLGTTGEALQQFIEANPFSPTRRYVPPPDAAEPKEPQEAQKPQFVYKGRIQLGTRQRAILEDLTVRKTHFLEVGQQVAGYKVLDISENQVLLSDLQTDEEVAVVRTSEEDQ